MEDSSEWTRFHAFACQYDPESRLEVIRSDWRSLCDEYGEPLVRRAMAKAHQDCPTFHAWRRVSLERSRQYPERDVRYGKLFVAELDGTYDAFMRGALYPLELWASKEAWYRASGGGGGRSPFLEEGEK